MLLYALLACHGLSPLSDKSGDSGLIESQVESGSDDSARDDSAADDSAADDSATDDTGAQPSGDLATFQQGIDGALGGPDMLNRVAQSGGWPIDAGDGTFVFAALDEGWGLLQLAGDHEGWQGQNMALSHGIWWIRTTIANPSGSQYKLVAGADYFADPWARAYRYDTYGEISLVRGDGEHIERWPNIGDSQMQPRTVRVWVPARAVTHQLYVQDGQNLFDPDAFYGGWELQYSLGDSTMAVGIDNTPDRMDEYTQVQDFVYGEWMGGDGDAYADFLVNTVRPLVESEYGAAPRVGIMGSSLGGLISLHAALRDPAAWDYVASLSGTVGWGSIGANNETIIERYDAAGYTGVPIYLDSGGGPGQGCIDSDGDGIDDDSPDSSDNYCENRQLADTLAAEGWNWETDLWHWWEPDAGHNEAEWAARVWRPVAIFEDL